MFLKTNLLKYSKHGFKKKYGIKIEDHELKLEKEIITNSRVNMEINTEDKKSKNNDISLRNKLNLMLRKKF